jgi:hypothetical protein
LTITCSGRSGATAAGAVAGPAAEAPTLACVVAAGCDPVDFATADGTPAGTLS